MEAIMIALFAFANGWFAGFLFGRRTKKPEPKQEAGFYGGYYAEDDDPDEEDEIARRKREENIGFFS
ncbi:hypothetical protein BSNK01_11990 [Bacillaceae bacterium]